MVENISLMGSKINERRVMKVNGNDKMQFLANTKEDIVYYINSIVLIKGIRFVDLEDRFGILVIRCSDENGVDESKNNEILKRVTDKKSSGKINFYNDPIGGMRITIK